MSIIVGVVIGVLIGWHLPQPQWAANVQATIVAKVKSWFAKS